MLRRTAALATAGALALGGVALLVPTSASATQAQVTAEANHARRLTPAERHQLRHTGHTTVTRQTKKHGTVTVQVQRGVVTAASPTSVSLKSKDGFTHSYAITAKTKHLGAVTELKVGERAQVIAVKDSARRIRVLKARAA